jgi:hypothetical protein
MSDDGVDIVDDTTFAVVDHCDGPVAGRCPRAGSDGVVACAGRRIDPADASPEYTLLQVPAGSRHCPLAWNLEAFGM